MVTSMFHHFYSLEVKTNASDPTALFTFHKVTNAAHRRVWNDLKSLICSLIATPPPHTTSTQTLSWLFLPHTPSRVLTEVKNIHRAGNIVYVLLEQEVGAGQRAGRLQPKARPPVHHDTSLHHHTNIKTTSTSIIHLLTLIFNNKCV